jgi:hypothetical protein
MARMTTTIQKKNTMMPGMEYPAIVLALAMAASYPLLSDLFASLASGPVTGYLTAGTPVSGPGGGCHDEAAPAAGLGWIAAALLCSISGRAAFLACNVRSVIGICLFAGIAVTMRSEAGHPPGLASLPSLPLGGDGQAVPGR